MESRPVPSLNESGHSNPVVMLLRAGHRDEALHLLAAYRPYLRQLAEKSLPDSLRRRVDGSDLVQETLQRGVTQLDEFRGTTDEELAAWLKQIQDNLLVDWLRFHQASRRDIRQEIPTNESLASLERSPSSVVRHSETCAQLTAALEVLTPEQRLVIELRNQGQGFEDIGQQTGRSSDAARMVWARAVARLGKLMQGHGNSAK